jgi:hypothetical protein
MDEGEMTEKTTRSHKEVDTDSDAQKRREFMHAMLADLRALERMLRENRLETGPRRIGAEQEMFLIDRSWGPANAALQMMDKLADNHYTTELGSSSSRRTPIRSCSPATASRRWRSRSTLVDKARKARPSSASRRC